MIRATLILFLVSLVSLRANSTDEVILSVQRCIEQGESFGEVEETLEDLSIADLKSLSATFEKAWLGLEKDYLQSYSNFVSSRFKGPARTENMKRVRELRKNFHAVRQLGEGPMKAKLKEVSMPAMKELRAILMPESKDLLPEAPDELKEKHRLVHGLAVFRDLLQEYAVSVGADDTPGTLKAAEQAIVVKYQDLDRKGLRIIEDNDKIAAKADLPEAERRGIRELNEMRLLIEQNALEIDPKLCDAARGHSQDMAEKGFFAHDSPVPGKKTPSDRARAAGTTGGGENIYMGSPQPEAANKGWFFSPGHHKNMFSPGYRRVGLGQFNRHWTQMFGG
ncbi:CAP domain-containing protein [Roseibacillus persicicus]|uniref:CAP domain-containing protein n=1 Tax=Roseibacillus persicicus TaxID=454148 RepID=UPI00280EA9B4|nr:CAP domain-containing protein [Roseibacillus persicicus]MDQ8191360.1 CAP domain-containing protein [Roseibacillus persicicus]